MPSSAVSGVLAAVSIAFGSCAGLFGAVSQTGDTVCMDATAHASECAVPLTGPFAPTATCEGATTQCTAACFADASCDAIFAFVNERLDDTAQEPLSACINDCIH